MSFLKKNALVCSILLVLASFTMSVRAVAQAKPAPAISASRIRARKELGMLGVEYSRDSFVKQAAEGDSIAVRLFIAAGMDPNVVSGKAMDGRSPLTAAVGACQFETVRILLAKGSDPNQSDGSDLGGMLPLVSADSCKAGTSMAKLLVAAGANVNARNRSKATPLISLARSNNPDVFDFLLANSPDTSMSDFAGTTALINAVQTGHLDKVKALLKIGADVNAVDSLGESPLFHGILINRLDLATVLLENGADPNTVSESNVTPLMKVAESCFGNAEYCTAALALLIKWGADVNLRTQSGTALEVLTRLHIAGPFRQLLIDAGAK